MFKAACDIIKAQSHITRVPAQLQVFTYTPSQSSSHVLQVPVKVVDTVRGKAATQHRK